MNSTDRHGTRATDQPSEESAMLGDSQKSDHPGVYYVRPDKNTSLLVGVGILICAWFANDWASGVAENAEQALQISRQAQQTNEQQTELLNALPGRIDAMVSNTVAPIEQRMTDIRADAADAYTVEAAQRDRAENQQAFSQLRTEVNANQSTISATTGRVVSVEKAVADINRKLEQIYQAVLQSGAAGSAESGFQHPVYQLPARRLWQ